MLNKSSYMVLNYNTSPVAIKTRNSSELIPAGNDSVPSGVPLSVDDIVYANNSGNAFKCGLLRFEEEYEADLYAELRITDWRSILTNKEIYAIILDPDTDGLQKLIDITDPMYFDRVYGAFIGLKNAGATVSTKVDEVMRARRHELKDHKKVSSIKITPAVNATESGGNADITAMRKQMEEMQKIIDSLRKASNDAPVSTDDVVKSTKRSTSRRATKSVTKDSDEGAAEEKA